MLVVWLWSTYFLGTLPKSDEGAVSYPKATMVANFDGNVRRLRVTEWYRYACTCSLAYRYLTEYRSVHVRQQCINSCLSLSVLACQQRPSVSPGSRPLSANQNNIRSNSILLELTGTRPGPTGRLGCRTPLGSALAWR